MSDDAARRWWTEGEQVVGRAVQELTDDELAADSGLPGWSRAHVVAHLSRNADALVNLLTWARTGVETPMYPSRAVRDADIDATAARPPAEVRADNAAARERLARAVDELPAEAWSAEVRNGQGAPVQASAVPFMRAKEVWVHGVDLRAGLFFADLPAARPPAEVRADNAAARERLARAVDELPAGAWSVEVRNGQGAPVLASAVPFMRAKEVWVHGVDLRAGLSFADLSADFSTALVDDVLGLFHSRDQQLDVTVVATDVDRTWGDGRTRVEGPVSAVAAWLTRSDAGGLAGDVPPPPAWL